MAADCSSLPVWRAALPLAQPGRSRTAAALSAAAMVASAHAGVADNAADTLRHASCRVVRGTLAPDCNGAICRQGRVTGDLDGVFHTKVTSIYPAGSGWKYSAWLTIDAAGGRLDLLVDGVALKDAHGGPDFASSSELLTVSETNGRYQDHTGSLLLGGTHALGQVTAYIGWLCRPS